MSGALQSTVTCWMQRVCLPNEKVHVVNNNNGARFETYIIAGERGSGVICVNGAAARLVQHGDIVIIISYVYVSDEEARTHEPTVLLMDEKNGMKEVIKEGMAL